MGWIHGTDEQRCEKRDEAIRNHIAHWEPHGGTPNLDCFGPGFDAGWAEGNTFRAEGRPDPEDIQGYAAGQRGRFDIPEGEDPDVHWEWVHGFWQGMQQAFACSTWNADEGGEEHHEEQQQEGAS